MNKSIVFTAILCLLAGWFLGQRVMGEKTGNKNVEGISGDLSNCADSLRTVVFSCAMHPKVQRQQKGACPFCGMALTTSVRNAYQQKLRVSMTEAAMELAQVRTQKVELATQMSRTIFLDGVIAPDEARVYHQIAHLPGRIDKLYVNKVGTFVKKGDPIANVYSKELIAVVEAFEYSKKSSGVLRSAVNNIKSWKVTTDQLNELNVKSGRYQKAVDVYSDFTGTILEVKVKEGEYAVNTHMGAPTTLFKIADLSKLWGMFDVHEKDLGQIRVGQQVQFSVPAYPGEVFMATVNKIYPEVNSRSQRVQIRTIISNSEGRLKPGMLAMGELTIPINKQSQLLIPRTAILWTGKKSLVYVKDPHYDRPVFEWREVNLGNTLDDQYLVMSGLKVGEEIVINGALRVDATAQLDQKFSMMNSPDDNDFDDRLQLVNN